MKRSKIKVIVTGGCGFIGSHLVDKLVEENFDVNVIDDLSATSNEKFYFNKKAKYFKKSILNKAGVSKIFKNAVYVFHLAAESRIQTAIQNPKYAYEVNLLGTFNILELSKENKIKKVIISSTSAIYGLTENFPTNEKEKPNCLNPYSLSKLFCEELSKQYLSNMDIIIFRYFNVFGERSPQKGQYAPVVGIFLNQKNLNKPLTIVGDGNQKRDFIHVSDIVNANLLAAKTNLSIKGDIFNVGSGKNYTINEIANQISKNQINLPERPGESRNTLADITKITQKLNFLPSIDVIKWIKKINKKH